MSRINARAAYSHLSDNKGVCCIRNHSKLFSSCFCGLPVWVGFSWVVFLVLAGLTSYIHGQSLDLLGLAGVGWPHLGWLVSLYSLWSLIIQQTGPSLFTQQGHSSKEASGSMQRPLKTRLWTGMASLSPHSISQSKPQVQPILKADGIDSVSTWKELQSHIAWRSLYRGKDTIMAVFVNYLPQFVFRPQWFISLLYAKYT